VVTVNGATTAQGLSYQLQSEERLAIRTDAGRLVAQDVISQESLLRSGKRPLQVSMGIPDVVLTGSSYDIDLIVDEPLGQAIVAGGLIELTDQQLTTLSQPNLRLAPLGGGGLFKRVQAPQRPGSQTWALMLVHPDGVVTATKRVQIVSESQRSSPDLARNLSLNQLNRYDFVQNGDAGLTRPRRHGPRSIKVFSRLATSCVTGRSRFTSSAASRAMPRSL
jgi:hypothetical protein